MTAAALNPALESQAIFRTLMDAFAAPGTIKTLSQLAAPAPLAPASAALLRALADFETPVWLDETLSTSAVTDWIRFHTGAPVTSDKRAASFALISSSADKPDFRQFALGSEEYPDRSTTVVLQVESVRHGDTFVLTGPGIRTSQLMHADPLPPDFEASMAANRELFPRGIDLVLVAGEHLAAMPRTVRIARGP